MEFNHYFNNQELKSILHEWIQTYPKLTTLIQIGESYEKRPIWLLTITNKDTGPDNEKPAIWLDGNIHATEIAGTTTTLYIAYNLLSKYGNDPHITQLLDTSVYYIVPRVNPDGSELAMAANPRYIRSGVRLYPWEDKDEGLHQQDVDGDGRILQMRILDPNGDWKISSLDKRLMEKRQPDDYGNTYYRLLPEGLIDDFDGYQIKLARTPEGLDFNRNFPYEWKSEADQQGAGPYPTSEAETKTLVEFITKHLNINAIMTYHTFSGVILRSYSTKPDDEMDIEDLWVYKKIGSIGTQLTGYRCVSTFHDFKSHPKDLTYGAFDDWMFDHFGAYAFTIELWDLPTMAGIKDRKFIEWFREHPHEDDLKIIQWADANAGKDAYVDWYPYDHPQLGKVELGGWNNMFTWRNPPLDFIEKEAARNLPFAISMGDLLPHLSIHSLKVTPLGNNDYKVNLVIENTGFFPTYTSQQGKKRQSTRPVRADLELPDGVIIINGKRRVELGHLEGRNNKLDVTAIWGAASTDNRTRVEWVLHGPPDSVVKLSVQSERAGSLRREIILK